MISAHEQASVDVHFMHEALRAGAEAGLRGEVPIGCVIVHDGKIIARASNRLEEVQRPTAHAEILAIEEAAAHLGSRRLLDCTMYVSLEPCCMCAGAIVNARIPRLVYAAADPKAGAVHSLYSLTTDSRLNHRCQILSGVSAEESSMMLKEFFQRLRQEKKESVDGN